MKSQPGSITLGCEVVIELNYRSGNKERIKFVIVDEKAAEFSQGYLSENTPIAKAILGEKSGNIIPYLKEDILSIHILEVTQSPKKPPEDATEKREAMMKKTMREVQDTNAMVFASSFSGKWGDYDPDSITKEKKSEETSDNS
jgi:hypothetical protein